MSEIAEIQDSEVDSLLSGERFVVIYLMAPQSDSCRNLFPIMAQLANTYDGLAKIVKLDISKNKITPQKFSAYIIPAVLIFKNGILVEKLLWIATYENFRGIIDQHI